MMSREDERLGVNTSGAPPARLVRVIFWAVGAEKTLCVGVGLTVGAGVGVAGGVDWDLEYEFQSRVIFVAERKKWRFSTGGGVARKVVVATYFLAGRVVMRVKV